MSHQGQPVIVGARAGRPWGRAVPGPTRAGRPSRRDARRAPRQPKALAVNPRTLERFLWAFVFPRAVTLPFGRGLTVRTVSGLDHDLSDFLPAARAGRESELVKAG